MVASSAVVFHFVLAWRRRVEGLDLFQIFSAGVLLAGIVMVQSARAGKAIYAELAINTGPTATIAETLRRHCAAA